MGGRKRITQDDINVPEYATEVTGGYPVRVFVNELGWRMTAHIFAPVMASPRPRVTKFGTFMPTDYKKHCLKLGASMAYARGVFEAETCSKWDATAQMSVDLAFWSPKMPGDIDNLAKTVLDAGQLAKGEPTGAELWANDRQITRLCADWLPVEDDFDWQTVVRINYLPSR